VFWHSPIPPLSSKQASPRLLGWQLVIKQWLPIQRALMAQGVGGEPVLLLPVPEPVVELVPVVLVEPPLVDPLVVEPVVVVVLLVVLPVVDPLVVPLVPVVKGALGDPQPSRTRTATKPMLMGLTISALSPRQRPSHPRVVSGGRD
jgi:hypothetical protein